MDCSQACSYVHGTFQGRILDWVAISSSWGYSWPRNLTHISSISRQFLYHWDTWEDPYNLQGVINSFLEWKTQIQTVSFLASLSFIICKLHHWKCRISIFKNKKLIFLKNTRYWKQNTLDTKLNFIYDNIRAGMKTRHLCTWWNIVFPRVLFTVLFIEAIYIYWVSICCCKSWTWLSD